MRFKTLKMIRSEAVFDTAKIQPKKLNDCKGPPRSQWDLEKALVLCKDQS